MSRYADTSASGITRRLAQKAVASYYVNKPVTAATGSLDASTLLQLKQGQLPIVEGPTGAVESGGCCCPQGDVTLNIGWQPIPTPPAYPAPFNTGLSVGYTITWSPAGNYTAIAHGPYIVDQAFYFTNTTTGRLYIKYSPAIPEQTTVKLYNSNGCVEGTTTIVILD